MKFLRSWAHSLVAFPTLGLDFSDLSIKFVRFDEWQRRLSVHYLGVAELPEGAIVNGAIEKPDEVVKVFKNLKSQDGRVVRERFVVASLPEEKGFIQLLRIPNLKLENLDAAVRWELEGVVPLPAEDIYVDYEVVPSATHLDHTDVLVLAYPRILVDAYTRVIRLAGMIPVALELESQAIVRSLISPTNIKPMLVIDLGATRTSFVLVANSNIIHTSTMSISGRMFESDIAKAAGVSLEEAHRLKIEVGLDLKQNDGVVARILLESLRPLVEEILRHIDFYRNHSRDRGMYQDSIEKIILTGGDANLIGLDSFLSRSVKVDVEKWNPFALILPKMGRTLPPVPANMAHEYTTAIGLALRNLI